MLNAVCVKSCPDSKTVNLSPDGKKVTLDCVTTPKTPSCVIDYINYYESKNFLNRICFPRTNDEVSYNSTTQKKIKIYDPNTGDTFERVVDNNDVKNISGRVFIYEKAICRSLSDSSSIKQFCFC
jgi:hypothetical protein